MIHPALMHSVTYHYLWFTIWFFFALSEAKHTKWDKTRDDSGNGKTKRYWDSGTIYAGEFVRQTVLDSCIGANKGKGLGPWFVLAVKQTDKSISVNLAVTVLTKHVHLMYISLNHLYSHINRMALDGTASQWFVVPVVHTFQHVFWLCFAVTKCLSTVLTDENRKTTDICQISQKVAVFGQNCEVAKDSWWLVEFAWMVRL